MLKRVLVGALSVCGGILWAEDPIVVSGETRTVASESELGAATSVTLADGGLVAFTKSQTLAKTYAVSGEGGISVAAGQTVTAASANLTKGAVGKTFVKAGPGVLAQSSALSTVSTPSRWVIREGEFLLSPAGSQFGNHSAATALTLDIREGATLHLRSATTSGHSPIGPLELTGGRFLTENFTGTGREGNTAFKGGVVAHASATPSYISCPRWAHLNHVNADTTFDVETGATLIMDGILTNGVNGAWNANMPGQLTKKGGGELILLKRSGFTNGLRLEGGTVTVADPEGLGVGTVTVVADATLKVLPGVTVTCPPLAVEGACTLTVEGEGAFTAPATLPEGLTLVNHATGANASGGVTGTTLVLNGSRAVVNVAAGQTLTLTAVEEAMPGLGALTEVVKTGAGTLRFPASMAAFESLTIEDGFVETANEAGLGNTPRVTVKGGGVRVLASFTQAKTPLYFSGTGRLDVPAGITFGAHSNWFHSASAVVTKTGTGIWKLVTQFKLDGTVKADINAARWIIDEGRLQLYGGDNFGGYATRPNITLEAHEGTTIFTDNGGAHIPMCPLVLRGATLQAPLAQFTSSSDYSILRGVTWKGWGLLNTVTVQASKDGTPSRIISRVGHLKHQDKAPTFDIEEGATLEIAAAMDPGRGTTTAQPTDGAFVKKGKGTLRFLQPVGTTGTIDIQDGVVELGTKARFDPRAKLVLAPAAKLLLNDGALVANNVDLTSALCASADVWVDASRLTAADGATVTSIPNLGTAGGSFVQMNGMDGNNLVAAPTFVKDGIAGRGVLNFNGAQALTTAAYTNRGARVQVFFVVKWTSWDNNGGKGGMGKWGGPLSLMAVAPKKYSNATCDDNQSYGSLSFQHGSTVFDGLSCYYMDDGVSFSGKGLKVGEPFLTMSYRDSSNNSVGAKIVLDNGTSYVSDHVGQKTILDCDIDRMCLGGRLRKGAPQVSASDPTSNRMLIGQIGEVLAFSRTLTAAEQATVIAYLQNKWLTARTTQTDAGEKQLAQTVRVEVSEGATATYTGTSAATEGLETYVDKTGAGTLRYGGVTAGPALIGVEEGGLALKDGTVPSFVDVWVDAADAASYVTDADGRVTNLVNKGSAGGVFTRNARNTTTVPRGPRVTADGINGRATLTFEGGEALALNAYTNRTSPRQISVFMVFRRNSWKLTDLSNGAGAGKWAGAFSLARETLANSEEGQDGVCFETDDKGTNFLIDFGKSQTGEATHPGTGVPALFAFHCVSNGYFLAFETANSNIAKVPRWQSTAQNNEAFNIDLVQLGGRLATKGKPQWYGDGDVKNRMWEGEVAEFIVTTTPLTEAQEDDMFKYLRKKWFGTGDGTAMPPTWLSGLPATPALSEETTLAFAAGTRLEHAAACQTVGELVAEGAMDWTRVWSGANDAELKMFDVAGTVSLGGPVNLALDLLPKNPAVLLTAPTLEAVPFTVQAPKGQPSVRLRASAESDDAYLLIPTAGTVIIVR